MNYFNMIMTVKTYLDFIGSLVFLILLNFFVYYKISFVNISVIAQSCLVMFIFYLNKKKLSFMILIVEKYLLKFDEKQN